jgi:hypothetical protein
MRSSIRPPPVSRRDARGPIRVFAERTQALAQDDMVVCKDNPNRHEPKHPFGPQPRCPPLPAKRQPQCHGGADILLAVDGDRAADSLDRIEKAGQGEGLLVTTGRRVWVNLYGHTSPGEFAMANTDVLADVDDERRTGHVATTATYARGVEVGVAIPIGCIVPLAIAGAVLVGAGMLIGSQLSRPSTIAGADHVVVRVIDDGAPGGPQVISRQVVPLR